MRIYRKGSLDVKEMWGEAEVINHLKCDEMKAKQILDEVRAACRISGYGLVEKERIIEYLAEKERLQREREARYNADIATAESIAVLKEQVKTLKESSAASSEDAKKARIQSYVSNAIAIGAFVVALIALITNL